MQAHRSARLGRRLAKQALRVTVLLGSASPHHRTSQFLTPWNSHHTFLQRCLPGPKRAPQKGGNALWGLFWSRVLGAPSLSGPFGNLAPRPLRIPGVCPTPQTRARGFSSLAPERVAPAPPAALRQTPAQSRAAVLPGLTGPRVRGKPGCVRHASARSAEPGTARPRAARPAGRGRRRPGAPSGALREEPSQNGTDGKARGSRFLAG